MKDSDFINDSNVSNIKTYNPDIMKAIANDIDKPANDQYFRYGNMKDIVVFAGFGPEGEGIMFNGQRPEYIKSLLPRFYAITFIHKRTKSFHNEAIRLSNRFPNESIICEYWAGNATEKQISGITQVEYINGNYAIIETETKSRDIY